MLSTTSAPYPTQCYNCSEELILDFYWIVVNKHNRDIQYLVVDFEDDVPFNDPNWEEFEFEICSQCFAAQ